MECFLFCGLNQEEQQQAVKFFSTAEKFKKGDELYRNGSLGFLESGSAKVKRQNGIGGSVTVRSLRSGEVFGCASVFGNWQEGFSSIIAESTCICHYISENDFQQLITAFPKVAVNYIAYLTEKIRFLNRRLDTFSTDSSEQRIYEFLLSHTDQNGDVQLNVSISELARRLKLGRTSLYRCLNALETNGVLSRNGSLFHINN